MASTDGEPVWYTTGTVAAMFGVTDRTVANWADAGILPHRTTPGGHRRFAAAAVHALVERRTGA